MESETVHLHTNRLNHGLNLFLLFIPAIVFVLTLAFLLSNRTKEDIATTSQPSILGDETEFPPTLK